MYEPPLTVTNRILVLIAEVGEILGFWSASGEKMTPDLRKENRIRTIQASLAIERNSLSVEQVSAILEGKRVVGSAREIQEVKNAITARKNYLKPAIQAGLIEMENPASPNSPKQRYFRVRQG